MIMSNKEGRTEIQDLGEFGLIKSLQERYGATLATTIKGIGDDAAVIEKNDEEYFLISTDTLTEGIHFDLTYVPLKHLGYKAVAVNVSDIAAMNGKAEHITVSLALSNRFSLEAIHELYLGMHLACQAYGIDLVGGDTVSSRSGLMISITAVGSVKKENVVYRSGAKKNDLICITGDLGGAYTGLQVLEREKQVFMANPEMQPELEGKDYIVQRQLKPEARIDIVKELEALQIKPTSMIDISDGLGSELLHLCQASGLGAEIYEEKIPMDECTFETANEMSLSPITCILNGGEDYELLFTVDQSDFEKLRNHPSISVIGYMQDVTLGVNLVSRGGTSIAVKAQGFRHF